MDVYIKDPDGGELCLEVDEGILVLDLQERAGTQKGEVLWIEEIDLELVDGEVTVVEAGILPGHHVHRRPVIHFTIDGEPFETRQRKWLVSNLIKLAGLDPANYVLLKRKRDGKTEVLDTGSEIHLKEGEVFISDYIGPTPVE